MKVHPENGLETLEAQLPVSDILIFRIMAERRMQLAETQQQQSDSEAGQQPPDSNRCSGLFFVISCHACMAMKRQYFVHDVVEHVRM